MTSKTSWAAIVILGPLICVAPGLAKAADWDVRWYNPAPAGEDLVLPIPCGGSIVFRPVDVPEATSPLADRSVTLGEPEGELGFIEYQRAAFLAAPFPAGDNARRFFMGKYDVTRDQFTAIIGRDCPTPSPGGRIPQTNVAWVDAVRAASALSSWLLAHARDKLPRRGEALAYARLPTEDEWEFAARGGDHVSESDFLARTWPMPEGIEHYAQAGSGMTAGRAQQIGQLKPNPLGLYDMLGNVGQMMQEAFRLNRVGRLHGQAGGIVVRGGNYTTPPFTLHTAMREEMPPFNQQTNAPMVLPTVGFRLVLSAPSVGSLGEEEQAKQSFTEELGRRETSADDPTQAIAVLRDALPDDMLRHSLDRISAQLASDSRDRADQARTAMLAQMEAAAVMANFIWRLERDAKVLEAMVEDPAQVKPEEQPKFRATIQRRRDQQMASLDGYLRLLRGIALGPASAEIEAQSALLRQELSGRGQQQLFSMLTIVTKHAVFERGGTALPRASALGDITAVPIADVAQ